MKNEFEANSNYINSEVKLTNLLLDKKKENLKYNKQDIPEMLKYNSDDEESNLSKADIFDNNNKNSNDNQKKIIEKYINNNKNNNKDEINENNIKEEKIEKNEKILYESLIIKKLKNFNDDNTNSEMNMQKGKIEEISKIIKETRNKESNNKIQSLNNKENKYSSKTFSGNIEDRDLKQYQRHTEYINNKNEEDNNKVNKEININEDEKKNVLKLLLLLKNKQKEKEKIDKEKELAEEEILKRAKSQEGKQNKKYEKKTVKNNLTKPIIYNKKRQTENKSMNIKSVGFFKNKIEEQDKIEKLGKIIKNYDKKISENILDNNKINKGTKEYSYFTKKQHSSNKSMDINKITSKNKKIDLKKRIHAKGIINNVYNPKKSKIKSQKSLGKVTENKKIINNFYFSNSNYNFNNYFNEAKNSPKIYRKKNLTLKENNSEFSNDYIINDFSKLNDNSLEKYDSNYQTNIENYDSSSNYISMSSNKIKSKKKIKLNANEKSSYINNLQIDCNRFKTNENRYHYNLKNNIIVYKNHSQKGNFALLKDIYNTENFNNMELNSKRIIKEHKWNLFRIEDLLIIEEKLNKLIELIKNNKEINEQCFDILNYYFNSSLIKKIEKIFNDIRFINTAESSIKFLLISLIICYEYFFNRAINHETKNEFLELIELNYNNLFVIIIQVINEIIRNNYNEDENIWIKYLLNLFTKNINKNLDLNIDNSLLLASKINQNNEEINIKIKNLLNIDNKNIINLYLKLKTNSYEDINIFFRTNILKIENIEGSLIAPIYLKYYPIFTSMNPPYIKSPNMKKYSLVLDLDETLVNFKIKSGKEGFVRLRPFLFGFLEEVSQYYELIIFTSGTEAYAKSVLEVIEYEKKYFDYVFYRQHTIIIGNDFVKDLTRIGRPLNSTIIIDNMPQNFRFQKENGICIKPFWGQDSNDKALYDLIPILLDIAKIGGDLRINLKKFNEDIVTKITSNIFNKNKVYN